MTGAIHGGPGRRSAAVAACILAVLLAGCSAVPGTGDGPVVEEVVDRTVSAAGVAALELQGADGGCEVRLWEEPRISIRATKRTRSGRAELDRVTVSVTEGSTVTVRTDRPVPPAPVTVDYAILVPATVGTIALETTNGRVVVDGVAAQVLARSSNGGIAVSGIGGGAELRTSNGAIEVRGANGVVSARTSNAAITVEGAAGIGDLETSNGRIAADLRAVFADAAIRTSNAAVDLAIGPGLDAAIDAEAPGGEVRLPAGLLQVQEQTATRLRATAGSGGHLVTVRTSNAPVRFAPGE